MNKKENKEKKEKKQKTPKSLVFNLNRKMGRNNQGRITSAHRGGGVKRLYRQVNFKRTKPGEFEIIDIQKDPNRSADIALIKSKKSGDFNYILANQSMKKGQEIKVGDSVPAKSGNRLQLKNIPTSSYIYNIELKAGQGGKIARSAGTAARLKAIEGKQALIEMPSGEIRLTSSSCRATIGELSNPEHGLQKLNKAGQSRKLGRRPTVRGTAKHPGAHPHGGGEGRSGIGLKYPKSPTGKHAKGKKTRKKKKYSDNLIISKRKKKKKK